MNRIIILALDTTNLEEAINITKKVKDKIFTVKLGLEFFNAHGKIGIKNLISLCDAKLYGKKANNKTKGTIHLYFFSFLKTRTIPRIENKISAFSLTKLMR